MFLKVEVTRTESTELYVEVPDDFDHSQLMRHEYQKELARIADETTHDSLDWDNSEWEETVEVQSISKVSEDQAKQYTCGKLEVQS